MMKPIPCVTNNPKVNMMKPSLRNTFILLATLLAISSSALAQYVWLDEKGNKQFSDQPPPPSVPKNKIVRSAGMSMDTQQAAPASDGKADIKQPESLAEKELAYKKQHDAMAAKEKKDAEEASNAQKKKDNCRRLQEYKRTLDSGQRMSQTDAKGNKVYINDESRAKLQSEATQNLSSECN